MPFSILDRLQLAATTFMNSTKMTLLASSNTAIHCHFCLDKFHWAIAKVQRFTKLSTLLLNMKLNERLPNSHLWALTRADEERFIEEEEHLV